MYILRIYECSGYKINNCKSCENKNVFCSNYKDKRFYFKFLAEWYSMFLDDNVVVDIFKELKPLKIVRFTCPTFGGKFHSYAYIYWPDKHQANYINNLIENGRTNIRKHPIKENCYIITPKRDNKTLYNPT